MRKPVEPSIMFECWLILKTGNDRKISYPLQYLHTCLNVFQHLVCFQCRRYFQHTAKSAGASGLGEASDIDTWVGLDSTKQHRCVLLLSRYCWVHPSGSSRRWSIRLGHPGTVPSDAAVLATRALSVIEQRTCRILWVSRRHCGKCFPRLPVYTSSYDTVWQAVKKCVGLEVKLHIS